MTKFTHLLVVCHLVQIQFVVQFQHSPRRLIVLATPFKRQKNFVFKLKFPIRQTHWLVWTDCSVSKRLVLREKVPSVLCIYNSGMKREHCLSHTNLSCLLQHTGECEWKCDIFSQHHLPQRVFSLLSQYAVRSIQELKHKSLHFRCEFSGLTETMQFLHETNVNWYKWKQLFSFLFSRALLLARRDSTCRLSGCLSVVGPPWKRDFWAAQAILSNFFFGKAIFFSPQFFFFTSKKFSHFHFLMHFWMFYAILSAQKNFHPKFFWVKQGATQCYQAFLVFQWLETLIEWF